MRSMAREKLHYIWLQREAALLLLEHGADPNTRPEIITSHGLREIG